MADDWRCPCGALETGSHLVCRTCGWHRTRPSECCCDQLPADLDALAADPHGHHPQCPLYVAPAET